MDRQSDLLPIPASAPALPTRSLALQRIIEWGPDGGPLLTTAPVVTKPMLREAYLIAAAQPYLSPELDPFHPDHEFDGMAKAEVVIRKHLLRAAVSGELADIESVLDRLLDKPKQSSENVTVTASYETWLKKVAAEEASHTPASLQGFE